MMMGSSAGEPIHVFHSALASCLCTGVLVAIWTAAVPFFAELFAMTERRAANSDRAYIVEGFLGIAGPLLSVTSMAAPVLAVM